MGKKSKILYFTLLIVNIVCFVLDFLPLPVDINFFTYSFPASLILVGLLLIIRAFTLKLDSSLFIGIVSLLGGVLNILSKLGSKFWAWDINQFWPYYLFALAIASLVTAIYFKDIFQVKLFFLFLGFGFIVLLFVQHLIVLWVMIVLLIVWFAGYFTINSILAKRRKDNGQN